MNSADKQAAHAKPQVVSRDFRLCVAVPIHFRFSPGSPNLRGEKPVLADTMPRSNNPCKPVLDLSNASVLAFEGLSISMNQVFSQKIGL